MSEQKSGDKFALSTLAGKAGVQLVVGAGAFGLVVAAIRVIKPDLVWDPAMDAMMLEDLNKALQHIGAMIPLILAAWGIFKNIWKNWHLVKNGVTLTKK